MHGRDAPNHTGKPSSKFNKLSPPATNYVRITVLCANIPITVLLLTNQRTDAMKVNNLNGEERKIKNIL